MDWNNPEHTIILVTFDGVWESADIYRMINKGVSMLKSVNHPVDSIFDFTRSTFSPTNLLSAAEKMENDLQENNRLAVIVKANVYIRSIIKVAKIFAPKALENIYFVNTLEQAYHLIQTYSDQVIIQEIK